jgi:6-phosphogluconate dehydrogenase
MLKRPRRVMLLVKAGPAVDDFIEALLPHLEKGIPAYSTFDIGDIIIDGGNSHFPDSNRRCQYLKDKGYFASFTQAKIVSCSSALVSLVVRKELVMALL